MEDNEEKQPVPPSDPDEPVYVLSNENLNIDPERMSFFEKKAMDINSKFTAGELSEAETEELMQKVLDEMLEEMGTTLEGFVSSMMGLIVEGMSEIFGSMFSPSPWSEQIPSEDEILAIAKKYYDEHRGLIPKDQEKEFSEDVEDVFFDGMCYDNVRADVLCNKSIAHSDFSYAATAAAAAVAWASSYPRSADTLARVLNREPFTEDDERHKDSERMSRYAIWLDPNTPDLYITLARILNKKGNKDGALDALNEALSFQPDHAEALKLKKEIE